MSQPLHPEGTLPSAPPGAPATWSPEGAWSPPPPPDGAWSPFAAEPGRPGWSPAAWPAQAPPPAGRSGRRRTVLVAVGSALAGLVVGAVGTGLVLGAAVVAGTGGLAGAEVFDDTALAEEVERFPPTAPADPGTDPVLDRYAQDCFDGDLQACDDLYLDSPPLSAHETYAATCGGRVKPFVVALCTDLG